MEQMTTKGQITHFWEGNFRLNSSMIFSTSNMEVSKTRVTILTDCWGSDSFSRSDRRIQSSDYFPTLRTQFILTRRRLSLQEGHQLMTCLSVLPFTITVDRSVNQCVTRIQFISFRNKLETLPLIKCKCSETFYVIIEENLWSRIGATFNQGTEGKFTTRVNQLTVNHSHPTQSLTWPVLVSMKLLKSWVDE